MRRYSIRLWRVRLRLSDPSRLPDFVAFLAVPQITLRRLENDEIEIRPSSAADSQYHEMLVDLMLRAWNAAHGDADAWIISYAAGPQERVAPEGSDD